MHNSFCPLPPRAVPDGDIVIVIAGDRLLTRRQADGSLRLLRYPDFPLTDAVAVGTLSGALCAAALLREIPAETDPEDWRELRGALQALSRPERMAAARALELLRWRQRRQYCGMCGSMTEDDGVECARRCSSCGALFFPVIAPAVITLIHRGDQILLAHNRKFAGNIHSLIAGFVEAGESAEDAVRREIREEVGLEVTNIRYFGSQCWPFPNSLMLGFEADYSSGTVTPDGSEIVHADWYGIGDLPEIPRSGSIAREMIDHYRKTFACKE
ncbi:MAG: NAD(+) diphosphatase [Lentisphaeria bacterium]|nr:NAD(+) diphosphatase [Lentisphaeria bacterium]